jgi:hypothetical protein
MSIEQMLKETFNSSDPLQAGKQLILAFIEKIRQFIDAQDFLGLDEFLDELEEKPSLIAAVIVANSELAEQIDPAVRIAAAGIMDLVPEPVTIIASGSETVVIEPPVENEVSTIDTPLFTAHPSLLAEPVVVDVTTLPDLLAPEV